MSKEPYVWEKKKVHTVIGMTVLVLVLVGSFTIELLSDIVQDNQKLDRDLKAIIHNHKELKNKPKQVEKEILPQTCLERIPAYEVSL